MLRVGGAVWPVRPVCIFFAMALGAALADFQDVFRLQSNLFGNFSAKMRGKLANIFQMKAGVESQDIAMALRARNVAMRGLMPITIGLPDLVALVQDFRRSSGSRGWHRGAGGWQTG